MSFYTHGAEKKIEFDLLCAIQISVPFSNLHVLIGKWNFEN